MRADRRRRRLRDAAGRPGRMIDGLPQVESGDAGGEAVQRRATENDLGFELDHDPHLIHNLRRPGSGYVLSLPAVSREEGAPRAATPPLPSPETQDAQSAPASQRPVLPRSAVPLRRVLDGHSPRRFHFPSDDIPWHRNAEQGSDHHHARARRQDAPQRIEIGSERAGIDVVERDLDVGPDHRRCQVVALESREGHRPAHPPMGHGDGDLQCLRPAAPQFHARGRVLAGQLLPQDVDLGPARQGRRGTQDTADGDRRIDRKLPPDHGRSRFSQPTRDRPITPRTVSRARLLRRVRVTAAESPTRTSTSAGPPASSAS